MLFKKKFIIILSLLFMFCLNIKCQSIKVKEKKYIVISDKENIDWYFGKSIRLFDISADQLDSIEFILKDIIDSKGLQPYENYRFQYVCMKLDDEIVFIQAICEDSSFLGSMDEKGNLFWKEELTVIADGGDCYWTVKINLNHKNYTDLLINSDS